MSLSGLDTFLRESGVTTDAIARVYTTLNQILTGGVVVPGPFSDAAAVSIDIATLALDHLVETGLLRATSRVVCPNCRTPVTAEVQCPHCKAEDLDDDVTAISEVVYETVASPPPATAGLLNDLKTRATIGIITALPEEAAAVRAMLDGRMDHVANGRAYDFGEMPGLNGVHAVVHLQLPDAGNNISGARAAILLAQFPGVRDVVMVGIAGAIPSPTKPEDHVRLGDVVLSGRHGVIQYDYSKLGEDDEDEPRHPPRPPSERILDAAKRLATQTIEGRRPWIQIAARGAHITGSSRPLDAEDVLYATETEVLVHPADPNRHVGEPRIFLGPIASSNHLLKNRALRDRLRDRHNVRAVEMEGSGVADAAWGDGAGFFVVRGTVDYCDSKKGDVYRQYSAIQAAAVTRALLALIPIH